MEEWMDKGDQEKLMSRILTLPRGVQRLEKLGITKQFPKNYELERAGRKPKYCYVVKRGRVIGYEYTPNGDERIYAINEVNSIILEGNILFDLACNVSFKTSETSQLVLLDKVALQKAIYEDPEISMDIMESMTLKFLAAMNMVRQSNFHSVTYKVIELLVSYAQRFGVPYDGKLLIQEKISQQLMANLLGVNRVTVVRSINQLKDLGLIENINGHYCIRSIEKLRRHQDLLLYQN